MRIDLDQRPRAAIGVVCSRLRGERLMIASLTKLAAVVAPLLSLLSLPVHAAGNAAAGHQLAKQWCNTCHVVEESGAGPDTAPPFPVIAQKRKDRAWVRAWLVSPHPPMPNLNLTRQEIDDVVAYLDSLTAK
jgi:mono/diheme cytochrome c family protein